MKNVRSNLETKDIIDSGQLSEITFLCQKNIYEDSFYDFVIGAWPNVIKGVDFIDNWHIRNICTALQAISEGNIQNLLLNIPIRCMKSLLVSVLWPAWEWTRESSKKYVCVSHNSRLALEHGSKMRSLVSSDWYQYYWPISFVKDTDSLFKNYHGGQRISAGILSGITGVDADRVIADDPHSAENVYSDKEREKEIRSWLEQVVTRRNSESSSIIVVMQRLHYCDLSSIYEGDADFEWICYPMEYEKQNKRGRSSLGLKDPRKDDGEMLWPKRFSKDYIQKTYKSGKYSQYFISSVLQQRPAPMEGGLIKSTWIQYYKELPNVIDYTWSWDTAIKTGQDNDYTVGLLWAECESGFYLVKCFRDKTIYAQTKQNIINLYNAHPSSKVLIEDKASGQGICQDLKVSGSIPVIPITPTKDKQMRLNLSSGYFEAGKVFLPENEQWVFDYIQEIVTFPTAPHDDMVDATTQFLLYRMNKKEYVWDEMILIG